MCIHHTRQVVSVLRYALANSVEPFMEPLLELAIALLTLERLQQDAALEGPRVEGIGTQGMVAVVGDVLAVCGQGDAVWSRLAVEVVSLFAEAHPGEAAAALLQAPVLHVLGMLGVLDDDHARRCTGDALQQEYSDAQVSLEVKHHLLTAVAACLASADEEQIDCFRVRGVLPHVLLSTLHPGGVFGDGGGAGGGGGGVDGAAAAAGNGALPCRGVMWWRIILPQCNT